MKAMILAAGRGERLRPLTDSVPKPLIEVRGKPLIVRHLERLSAAGFRELVINVSHLGRMIEDALGDGSRWNLAIEWSRETEALETAGGLAFARSRLGEKPFLLVNADVYSDFPFENLRGRILGERLGYIILVPNPPFRRDGDFSLCGENVGNRSGGRYTYSGIGVLAPRILDGIVPGSRAPLAPALRRAAEARLLGGELYAGCWSDVGTPGRLAELNRMKGT